MVMWLPKILYSLALVIQTRFCVLKRKMGLWEAIKAFLMQNSLIDTHSKDNPFLYIVPALPIIAHPFITAYK